MSETIPLNPDVLRWARESAGYSIDDIVDKIKRKTVTAETIQAWENGNDSPSYPQLETLAYNIYKRPIALFFFPEPPEEETPEQSFRTLPKEEIELIEPRVLYLIRQARSMQENLRELFGNKNPVPKKIWLDINLRNYSSVSDTATSIRKYLGTDLNTQYKFQSIDKALKHWRNLLEDFGIFIFKEAFKEDDFSGFCLYDDAFPIIFVNSSQPKNRQVFTLFHELGHLLFRTGGVDLRHDEFVKRMHGQNKRIEVFCNKFAGEFLVPTKDIKKLLVGQEINDKLLSNLANKYSVSREVILRKSLDLKYITQVFYETKVKEWETERLERPKSNKGRGPTYYQTRGAYLGEHYIETVFSKYYQGAISKSELAEYLGIKEANVGKFEGHLLSRS